MVWGIAWQELGGISPNASCLKPAYMTCKADTAGKAKSYLGIVPGKGLRSGQKLNMNPEAKDKGCSLLYPPKAGFGC